MLAKVDWDDHKYIVGALAMPVALGGSFLEVLAQMPLPAKLMITQPVISGSLTLVVPHTLLCGTPPADT